MKFTKRKTRTFLSLNSTTPNRVLVFWFPGDDGLKKLVEPHEDGKFVYLLPGSGYWIDKDGKFVDPSGYSLYDSSIKPVGRVTLP